MLDLMVLMAALAAEPGLTWSESPQSLGLARGGQVVWQYNYAKDEGKPYFHPLALGDAALTELRPADHRWHRACWFSWKTIDGVNYWEEDRQTGRSAGETRLVETRTQTLADRSARIEQRLQYGKPGEGPILDERRRIVVSPPDATGGYTLDWSSRFTPTAGDVRLERTPILGEAGGVAHGGYAGLSLRLAPALKEWKFNDEHGPVAERMKRARWLAYSGALAGTPAAIVVFDHPQNPRHPTPWYMVPRMPYFSPALLYQSAFTLTAGKSLSLRYLVKMQRAAVDVAAVNAAFDAFARTAETPRIDR